MKIDCTAAERVDAIGLPQVGLLLTLHLRLQLQVKGNHITGKTGDVKGIGRGLRLLVNPPVCTCEVVPLACAWSAEFVCAVPVGTIV